MSVLLMIFFHFKVIHGIILPMSLGLILKKSNAEVLNFCPFFPLQLHRFLRGVSFNNSAGDWISFNQNGEVVAGLDVINWIVFSNQSFHRVKVGRIDSQTPPGQMLTIEEDAIRWHSWFNQVGSYFGQKQFSLTLN